jgi:hypothetical protein
MDQAPPGDGGAQVVPRTFCDRSRTISPILCDNSERTDGTSNGASKHTCEANAGVNIGRESEAVADAAKTTRKLRTGHSEGLSGDNLFPEGLPSIVRARIQSALRLLFDAASCAKDVGSNLWQFSVEVADLRSAGLTPTECRWLSAKGLAKHACEITRSDSSSRVFRSCPNLSLPEQACFVITNQGIAYANALFGSEFHPAHLDAAAALTSAVPAPATDDRLLYGLPQWDSDRQQLRVGWVIVKEFKVPAANQEAILVAFQEENWAPRIDDPLVPKPNLDAKRRLRDTINCLNRKQKNPLIRFHCDGRGEGIRWELTREQPVRIEMRGI